MKRITFGRNPSDTALPTILDSHRGQVRVLSGDGSTTDDELYFARSDAGTVEWVRVAHADDLSGKVSTTAPVLSGHVDSTGSTPTVAKGASAGSTATASITGNDTAGQFSVTPNGTGIAAGHLVTVTFATVRDDANYVPILQETSSGASALGPVRITNRTTSGFQVYALSAPSAGTAYQWGYWCVQY